MMSISVKQANKEETNIVHHIMAAAFQEYKGKLNPPSGALTETVEDILKAFEQGGGSVIAWKGNGAIGSARYKYDSHFIYIGRVSVLPEYRGLGIGKSMLHFLEEMARSASVWEARVAVRLSIPENIEMYLKLNYEIIDHKYYPERTDSWYVMAKSLQRGS
jgi:ribosomal protein S18 acetylase RimI-like enzyme